MDDEIGPDALADSFEDAGLEASDAVVLGGFFVAESDGALKYQGREIGNSPQIRNALLRQLHWTELLEECAITDEAQTFPFLGAPPAGYASVCEVDGQLGVELVMPFSKETPGQPYNRVLLCSAGAYNRATKKELTDVELFGVLQLWADAGVN